MLKAEETNERTMLDYLNKDCWRLVLQYVPVEDLIRTEHAGRRWQQLVLTYLRGIRIIVEIFFNDDYLIHTLSTYKMHQNAYSLTLQDDLTESFEKWTQKLGLSVVAAYCNSLERLSILKENCPNLEALTFIYVEFYEAEQLLPYNLHENFKCLQRVSFSICELTDSCVNQFVGSKAFEEMEFYRCAKMTGDCFISMDLSYLRSFTLYCCMDMDAKYTLPAAKGFGELKKLCLHFIYKIPMVEFMSMLDKMPKLEWLDMIDSMYREPTVWRESEPLSGLTRLRHLNVSVYLTDKVVTEVTRCCQDLQVLALLSCHAMTRRVIEPLCRNAGARLISLRLEVFHEARDDDVVALVLGCPHLETLAVTYTMELTTSLPKRAAAARRAVAPGRPLLLHLTNTNLTKEYEKEMISVKSSFKEMKRKYEDVTIVIGGLIY